MADGIRRIRVDVEIARVIRQRREANEFRQRSDRRHRAAGDRMDRREQMMHGIEVRRIVGDVNLVRRAVVLDGFFVLLARAFGAVVDHLLHVVAVERVARHAAQDAVSRCQKSHIAIFCLRVGTDRCEIFVVGHRSACRMRSGLAQFRTAVHAGLQEAFIARGAVDHRGTAQLRDVGGRMVRIVLELRRQIRA